MPLENNASIFDRCEAFGVNCEFGFVLKHYKYTRTMLFRWTYIELKSIIDLLNNDFSEAFAFENIVAIKKMMVKDKKYNWLFHSAMHSNGSGQFDLTGDALRNLFRIEHAKIQSDIDKLKQRLAQGNILFVHVADVKRGVINVTDAAAQALLEAIDVRAKNRLNKLLVVGEPFESSNEVGKCYDIGERAFRGVVARLAPAAQASQADLQSWDKILSACLTEV